jgi:hypothetical protein
LKNGAEVDARRAYVEWRSFEAIQTVKPAIFESFRNLALGRETQVTPDHMALLRQEYRHKFDNDGKLLPIIRDVLASSFRHAPDGPVLVNPFALSNAEDESIFAAIERQQHRILRDLFRRKDPPHGNSMP